MSNKYIYTIFTTDDIFDPNGKECTPVQWLLEI